MCCVFARSRTHPRLKTKHCTNRIELQFTKKKKVEDAYYDQRYGGYSPSRQPHPKDKGGGSEDDDGARPQLNGGGAR